MIEDFHAYEARLGREALLPLLDRAGIHLAGKRVLDVGCGYGGVLAALAERHALSEAYGIDLDAEMIRSGRERSPALRLEVKDFFTLSEPAFDLLLLRDVLEHIVDVEKALLHAVRLLAAGGAIYASFAPFYSPFGGHQHNGSGPASRVPWLHLLPESVFRSLLSLPGNSYKGGRQLAADMDSVLRTRLTLARFRRAAAAAGLRVAWSARYLSRPDYRIKFGLPQVGFPNLPVLGELFCTGAEALLVREVRA